MQEDVLTGANSSIETNKKQFPLNQAEGRRNKALSDGWVRYSEGQRELYGKLSLNRFHNINMTAKNSALLVLKILILIFHSGLVIEARAQCCLEFTDNSCIRCPAGMHLYRSNCIYDLEGCLEYAAGFDCSSCKSNYQLSAGICLHSRFPQGISSGSTFSLFLQSTLKPDGVMQSAQEAVEADEQLWIDWYNFTLISNKTYMNKNGLTRNALSLMNLTVGNPKLQFIFTSSLEKPAIRILLYRFTYELSSIGGFVDCLLAVEMVNSTQNYLQLNMVRKNSLSLQEKWNEVKAGDACEKYILKQMMQIFPQTASQSFVKGYWANVTDGLNFTMFFMSSNEGIVSYVYTADPEEMPVCSSSKDMNSQTTTPTEKTTITQKDNDRKIKNDTTVHPNPIPTQTPMPTPNSNTSSDSKQSTKAKVTENSSQTFVGLQNLQSNPIYSIGYAVIAQKYEISSSTVNALFYIEASPMLYGIYLSNNHTYIRFTFRINSTQGEFEIASYSQAARPFIEFNTQTAANASYANATYNTTSSGSASKPNPVIANTTQAPANCGKASSQFIDITSSQNKDIFLPRINLLLTTMYQYLANTRIKSVKYNLGYEPSFLSKITYQILYENMEGKNYDFQVAIVNNQFQLVKSPNSTQTTANAASPTPSTVESKPNVTDSQENATEKNVKSNESEKNKAQTVSPPNTLPASNTNITTTLNSSKQTKTAQTPIIANHTQAATNKTKLNTTSPTITEIPPKNYTSEPKYKSLITILKSLYRIPSNATVASMKTWEDVSTSSKYQVVFKMTYPIPLKDGTIAKISTYELTVNHSSFVSVQSEKIQFIKAPPPQPFEKPSLSLSLSLSPYLKAIFNLFTTHSPKLVSFVLQSLHLSAGSRTYGDSVTPYNEKIRFSKGKEAICFDVNYELIFFDNPANKGSIFNLIEYRIANCSNALFDNYNLSSAKFTNQSNISQAINMHMRVFSNGQVAVNAYQTYQQLCRVRFSSMNTGERQVVIDTQSLTVLTYRTSPRTLFTPHLKNTTFIDPNVVRTLQAEMQKIYKLAPGSILLQLIRKTNDDNQIWLVDVFGKVQIKSIWKQNIFRNLKMQALYYPQQSFLKIVNATALDLSYSTFLLESTAANWVEVPIESTFSQPKFPHIIASLKTTYSSFLDNSFLVSFYREPSSQYSTLEQYIVQKEGARFQILVSKQFTNNYHINYLLTVRYGAVSNTTELQNLQSVENSNITIRNCQTHDNSSTMPRCSQCQQFYVLLGNVCLPEITGCEEYFSNICSKCSPGYLSSKDMGKCLSLEDRKEDLIVNSLIVLASIPQQ